VAAAPASQVPGLATALWVVDQSGRAVGPLLRDVVLEHRRRLDDVIVDAHEDHVVQVHAGLLLGNQSRKTLYLPTP
jgi:hypothetical protein